MKRALILVTTILILLLPNIGVAFQNEPDGFRELNWGDPPTIDMVYHGKSKNNENTLWYIKRFTIPPKEKLQIGQVKLKNIYYLFYKTRFMCVHIELNKKDEDYNSLIDILTLKFGKGKEQGLFGRIGTLLDDETAEMQWSGDTTRITLYSRWGDESSKGRLEIKSIQIFDQRKADQEHERQEAAKEGLSDF